MIRLECTKTSRFWICADELSAYRRAMIAGLTDYETSPAALPKPEPVPARKRQRIMRAVGTPVSGMEIVG